MKDGWFRVMKLGKGFLNDKDCLEQNIPTKEKWPGGHFSFGVIIAD
jgi:hypothetical protein